MHPILRILVPAHLTDRGRKGLRWIAAGLLLSVAVPAAAAVVHVQIKASHAAPPAAVADDAPPPASTEWVMAWRGIDIDGDGQPDFADPTGHAPRGHDAFGDGYFSASRDGGRRMHEGVDYEGTPGQTVVAPLSGYITKIGHAYADDIENLEFVEVTNPALGYQARVFYVDPLVQVGDAVRLGDPIGVLRSLQDRYPGITNHVHLELMRGGKRFDAQTVIYADVVGRQVDNSQG